jgi:hypothetical protein
VSSGLDRCACKRGFYTLRDCGKAATTTCAICSRRVCDEHLAGGAGQQVCAECAARREEAAVLQPFGGEPVSWMKRAAIGAAFLRQRHYRTRSYQPMYWGTYDSYYQDYDYRWYGDDDDHDDDDNGFDDS